jgi:hypothetical protein
MVRVYSRTRKASDLMLALSFVMIFAGCEDDIDCLHEPFVTEYGTIDTLVFHPLVGVLEAVSGSCKDVSAPFSGFTSYSAVGCPEAANVPVWDHLLSRLAYSCTSSETINIMTKSTKRGLSGTYFFKRSNVFSRDVVTIHSNRLGMKSVDITMPFLPQFDVSGLFVSLHRRGDYSVLFETVPVSKSDVLVFESVFCLARRIGSRERNMIHLERAESSREFTFEGKGIVTQYVMSSDLVVFVMSQRNLSRPWYDRFRPAIDEDEERLIDS